jgi:hypothetical protein
MPSKSVDGDVRSAVGVPTKGTGIGPATTALYLLRDIPATIPRDNLEKFPEDVSKGFCRGILLVFGPQSP